MAIQATIVYQQQLDPTTFVLADTTPYSGLDSKSNIAARSLTIFDAYGNPLPGYQNPIIFPIGGTNPDTFTISGLTGDMALQVTMVLAPVSPQPGSIYTDTIDFATNRFLQQGLYNIQVAQNNSGYQSSQANSVYRTQSIDLIIAMQNSQTAVLYGDLTGAQAEINKGQNIINNAAL